MIIIYSKHRIKGYSLLAKSVRKNLKVSRQEIAAMHIMANKY